MVVVTMACGGREARSDVWVSLREVKEGRALEDRRKDSVRCREAQG